MKFVEDRYSCNKNQLFKEIKLRRDDDFQQVEEEVLLIKIDKANLRMMSSLLDILMDINSFTGQALLCVCVAVVLISCMPAQSIFSSISISLALGTL